MTVKMPDFLVIKLMVSQDKGQQTTQVIVIDKAKTGLKENFTDEIDWTAVNTRISGISQVRQMSMSSTRLRGVRPSAARQPTTNRHFDCYYCKKTFNRISNLSRHMTVHVESQQGAEAGSGDPKRSFQCDLCPCAYNFSSTLTRHMISAHMEHASVS